MKTLGQIGFEAYNASTGGKTFDGRDIPPWESVAAEKPHVAKAWEDAAKAIGQQSMRALAGGQFPVKFRGDFDGTGGSIELLPDGELPGVTTAFSKNPAGAIERTVGRLAATILALQGEIPSVFAESSPGDSPAREEFDAAVASLVEGAGRTAAA